MSIAKSYAQAFYEATLEQKSEKIGPEYFSQVEAQMDQLLALMDRSKELRTALLAPITTIFEKNKIIHDIGTKLKFSPQLLRFIDLLVQKKRLAILKGIRHHFSTVRLEREGGIAGELISADPLSEQDMGILAKAFSQKLGKKVSFQVSTDPLLLAGVKVTLNGVTYDGTLRSQLQKLRDSFVARA